jgi:enoyl-CoA hydratase/carnithine racemase
MADEAQVKFEMVEDGIAVITLNRPDRGNAHTQQMRDELDVLFRRCNDDDGVRVAVVTGAGRSFCVGADLAAGKTTFDVQSTAEEGPHHERSVYGFQVKKPIIGAVNGNAVGIGLTMTLSWDFIFVAENAKLAFPFVRRGIAPEMGSTWLLPRLVGLTRALELMLTGRIFSGTEAASYGIALAALPAEQVLPRALEFARELRDNSAPVSVAMTKKLIWQHLWSTDVLAAALIEDMSWQWAGRQPDAREGVASFLEKRKPHWTMRPSADWPDFHKE